MSTQKSSRSIKLRKVFTTVVKGEKAIDSSNAHQFLEAICDQDDRVVCVGKIASNEHGLAAFKSALTSSIALDFLQGPVTSILRYLAVPELKTYCGGTILSQLVLEFVDAPLVWNAYISAFKAKELLVEGEIAMSWILLELLSLPTEKASLFVELAQDDTITKNLLHSAQREVRLRGQRIVHIAANLTKGDQTTPSGPGGRHDNDFSDISKIEVLPTSDELATKDPYLPRAHETDKLAQRSDGLAFHIDGQFRLNREDMLRDMREELHIALNIQKGRKRAFTVDHLTMAGVYCNGRTPWALQLRCMNDLPELPKKDEQSRRKYLKDHPKYLRHESLACIVVDEEVITLGTLLREEDQIVHKPPVLCLQIPGVDTNQALRRMKTGKNIKLVQLSTAVFSYAPVLKQLKQMKELTFENEILRWNTDSRLKPPAYPLSPSFLQFLDKMRKDPSIDLQDILELPKSTKLDASQARCFLSGIAQRLCTLQGPPGTGKSFSGVILTKAIYCHSEERILVLTYKHHALNQFLEDLIKLGIPRSDIVRLGSVKKAAPSVQDLNMKDAASNIKLTREQMDMLDMIKRRAGDEGKGLEDAFGILEQAAFSRVDIMEYLEFLDDGPSFFSAFEVPTRKDGMTNVGRKGKAMDSLYLLDRWCRGKDASPFRNVAAKYPDVWNIKLSERLRLQESWKAEMLKERLESVRYAGQSYNEDLEQVASIYMERELKVLRSKRIIACTTTAAAKYVQSLSSVGPGVVIAEEAGEILESHILTALSPDTKHLILIGDHKQLRPKANYALSVEKGDGYDLNVSLFERLIRRGYPHETLSQQHRMRPELAEYVREMTYPGLVDAEKTKNRPHVKGLQDNIVFLNHNQLEEEMKGVRDLKDGTAPATKRNPFEIQMALKCVRYLGQQDIDRPTEKIAVLTPYLGQLHLLRDELSTTNDIVLNDLDSNDLVRAGLMPAATAKVGRPKIRISTIDNFQGDESEIIIVSLTRSNETGDIGFLSSPERLNVLLSRARNGLILIGNAATFMSSKKGGELWTRLLDMLKSKKHIYDGLPVKCEQHPDRLAILQRPEDFDRECRDGGCKETCGSLLNCGVHKCPRSCHYRSDHSRMTCEKIVDSKCSNGHVQKRKCHQAQPATCKICDTEDERKQKNLERDVELQDKRLKSQAKHDLDIADLEMEIRKIREEAADKQVALDRTQALEQKKRDLEAVRQNAARVSQQAQRKASPAAAAQASGSNQFPKKTTAESDNSLPRLQQDPPKAKKPPTDKSASELEWERQKKTEGALNESMDKLMALTGLEEVKEKFLNIKAKIETVERQGIDMKKERLGMVMLGNPGTGKTTVARIYGEFLASVGALPGKQFVEITGSGLANEGVPGTKKMIEGLVAAGGGIFFIDEAYQLASGSNLAGKNVLDFVLAEIEERRGVVAFILAGYTKEMEKFFEHNPGFDSRLPNRLTFADYTNGELLKMLDSLIERKYDGRAKLEDGNQGLYARILINRLGRKRGTEGYGNARALENVWQQVTERQSSRLRKERTAGKFPNDLFFMNADIIGPEPSGAIKESVAWKELQSMIGNEKVKNSVKALIDAIQRNYHRELKELQPLAFTLHRVFLGSPGTGKTTVAQLYGAILADIGLLSKREVVTKNPSDFIGAALGQSEESTKNILKAAEGKVLVIDEAYGLDAGGKVGGGNPDPYKTAVIDTIVAQVQNTPGEDRCVLMLGYKEPMEDMMSNSNPGLARRFRLDDAFHFEDFTDDQLLQILDLKLKKQGFKATDHAKRVAIEVLARQRDRPNFGNAGAVENILSRAKELEQKRSSALGAQNFDPEIVFLPEDFDEDYGRADATEISCRQLFADIVGCEKLRDQLETYQRIAKNMKAHGKDPRTQIPFNFIFKGPPGTGKTTVARKMSQLYYQMGILGTNDYVDCSASDLIGQYVGHTGPKTQDKLTEALGRVLFIDEAYRFCDGGFGKEAVNELVDSLTKPKYMGKIVVILAGYTNDMDELLRINPGLSSRFPEEVIFENMAPDKCLELLEKEIAREEISLVPPMDKTPPAQRHQMIDILADLSKLPSWGNGRDVKNLAKSICSEAFANSTSGGLTADAGDILRHLRKMLQAQRSRNELRSDSLISSTGPPEDSRPMMTIDPPKAPTRKTNIVIITKEAQNDEREQEGEPKDGANEDDDDSSPKRDPGVSDQVWQRLQASIATDKALRRAEQVFIAAQQNEYEKQKAAEEARLQEYRKLEAEARIAEEARRKEIEEQLQEEKRRIETALKAKREAEERHRKALEEQERKRKQEEAIQKKIHDMGICPAGFRWQKVGGGYRCTGGSHYMSNSQLGI